MSTTNASVPDKATQQANYALLHTLFPDVLEGVCNYVKMTAGDGMMPLSVECLHYSSEGKGRLAMAHYYVVNGDLMADPDMELIFDNTEKTVSAVTFQQDNVGVYRAVQLCDTPEQAVQLERDLSEFLSVWLGNIASSGYEPLVKHIEYNGEECKLFYSEGRVNKVQGSAEFVAQYKKEHFSQNIPVASAMER